jgi:probable phosphoglycerate mutase
MLPPTTVILVRHGEADNNEQGRFGGWSDLGLTPRGLAQVVDAGAAVAARRPTALYASDLRRAHQTAEAIAAATGLAVVPDPALRERSLGIFDGLAFADVEARHPALYAAMRRRDPDALPEGAEPVDTVFARVAGALDRLVARHPGETIAVVSHGIAIFHAFCHVTGLGSPARGHQVFALVDNASLSIVEHHRASPPWRLRVLNDTGHLAPRPAP